MDGRRYGMPRQSSPDLGAVLKFLRMARGWQQGELGKAAGIPGSLLSDYEQGRKTLSRKRLESLVALLGYSPDLIETTLAYLDIVRGPGSPLLGLDEESEKIRRSIEATALEAGRKMTQGVREMLTFLTSAGQALEARQNARTLWARLRRHSPEQRLKLVEGVRVFKDWALCERVAAESIAAAPNHPRTALELAALAVHIADRVPGAVQWRWRLQGYAWAHVGNARRACNDLPGAEAAMVKAKKLWEDGEVEGSGLLEPAWLPGLEAALRNDQRRFPEALKRIDEALSLDKGELRAQILIMKAKILETLGDPEGSTAILERAAALVDRQREPRLAFGLRLNSLVNLCLLGRAAEAESKLADVRELAKQLDEESDLARVVWLEGKIAAGTGRTTEACAAFQQVRRYFKTCGLVYDYALVSLELASALLAQGRAAEVRGLAAEMLWLFQAQGVHPEALAALRLFCEAAERERATVELTRRIVTYLHRAQHDPQLRFE